MVFHLGGTAYVIIHYLIDANDLVQSHLEKFAVFPQLCIKAVPILLQVCIFCFKRYEMELTSNGKDSVMMVNAVPTFWIPASIAIVRRIGNSSRNKEAAPKPRARPSRGNRNSATYNTAGTSLKISGKINTSKV